MDFSWATLVEGQKNNIKTVHWGETLEIMVVFALNGSAIYTASCGISYCFTFILQDRSFFYKTTDEFPWGYSAFLCSDTQRLLQEHMWGREGVLGKVL